MIRRFLWSLFLLTSCVLTIGAPTEARVIFDLLEHLPEASITNAASVEIRRPASAGRIEQDALYEHPNGPGGPARVRYRLQLPASHAQQKLLFVADLAIDDGVTWGPNVDGVRFAVSVNDRLRLSAHVRESRWQSQVVDLSQWAGQTVQLDLLTHCVGNTSYDWAVWGSPRILSITGPAVAQMPTCPAPYGVLIAKSKPGLEITLRPDQGEPLRLLATTNSTWIVKEFQFPRAKRVDVSCTPDSLCDPAQTWLAAYTPELELTVKPNQALVDSGQKAEWRTEILNRGRGQLEENQARVRLGGTELKTIPGLAPGESVEFESAQQASPGTGSLRLSAELMGGAWTQQATALVQVYDARDAQPLVKLENEHLQLQFSGGSNGYAWAKVFARQAEEWSHIANWTPLFKVVPADLPEPSWQVRTDATSTPRRAIFHATGQDSHGAHWKGTLEVELPAGSPTAQIRYRWSVDQLRDVLFLSGPNVYVGDNATGLAKSWGLFPGLEYLNGPERSSNPRDFAQPLADRRTPHPHKVTVPLLAVTVGPDSLPPPKEANRFFTPDSWLDRTSVAALKAPANVNALKGPVTVALSWDPLQKWDGRHQFPSPRFASPNFDQGMHNHRLGLYLPSCPEFVGEYGASSGQPYPMAPNQNLELKAELSVLSGHALQALRHWLDTRGGLPAPTAWPRSFQESLSICRAGFLKTLWNDATSQWSHCIGWAAGPSPGFAALLWIDSQIAEEAEARRQSAERVERALGVMLKESGPGVLVSQANCHIMQWELPFLRGHLAETLPTLEPQMRGLIQSQEPSGGWLFHPGGGKAATLGRDGDSVLGLCAQHASTLLRYARITGDTNTLAAGLKALEFMERFRVPRGAQTWECPAYEPDILAAAHAMRAYHDAFRITSDQRWLHDAVYWAESGVPFVYLWTLPDKPMMLGATIPVFGSTFYTHTWLGVPVQWCGLVYAYHLFHLAEELERQPLRVGASPLPLALGFKPADWKRLVEHITVSATYQQFAEGDKIGAYPDSISQFETRNPAFLNPEDLLVNLLALHGHDPDIKSVRAKTSQGEVVVSSAATIEQVEAKADHLLVTLRFYPNQTSHTLISGFAAEKVERDGTTGQAKALDWSNDPARRWLYLSVAHDTNPVRVKLLAK